MAHKKKQTQKSVKQAQKRKRPPPLSDAEARQLAPGHMTAAQAAVERQRFPDLADSARARQRRRTTKPRGLVTRERELVSARRELATVKGTGVASKAQLSRLKTAITSAERNVKAQQAAAKRAGRPTGS